MRKVILLIFILILLTGCGGLYNLESFVLPDDIDFIKTIEILDTPEKIGNYMLENFEYKAYYFTALSPYELFIYKKGDCDIFATFGVFVANHHDYITYQLWIFYKGFKHRIAIYKEDNYSITDNQYYSSGYNTFLEIVETDSILRDIKWTKYIVYDYWNDEVEIVYKN